MKYLVIFFLGLGIWFWFYQESNPRENQLLPKTSPETLKINIKNPAVVVDFNQKKYSIYLQKVTDPKNLSLIPNFSEKLNSSGIMKKNGCKYGINAGFYTNENKPLGLMFTQNKYLNSLPHNSLFLNGYFYKTFSDNIGISNTYPQNKMDFIFQSGPFFTSQGKLEITDDKPARRSLIAKDTDNRFYFLAIADSGNSQNGPMLSDLPELIREFNKISEVKLTDLLNLDGGSASAFYDDSGNILEELTYVGAFICGK